MTSESWWKDERFEQACEQRLAAEEPSEQRIRERAYQIYLARNGGPGDALSDWLEAEEQMRAP
jgi:Protein of unknown function (DUF2934)